VAVIDPEGLFNGDRLRHCSNAAQLHWPRLFLASDGFARIEINYARIIGRAYPTFSPAPSETELQAWLQEYSKNHLLFLYETDRQLWGQWDTRQELLPRYKTASDRRSPIPPEQAFAAWKLRRGDENRAFTKCFGNISEGSRRFLHGVGVGVGIGEGKNMCASDDARASDLLPGSLPSIDSPPFETTEPGALFPVEQPPAAPACVKPSGQGMTTEQEIWFTSWWAEYWLHKAKKAAREAFRVQVKTAELFRRVVAATRAQRPEMLYREESKRPHGATWLRGERWNDETAAPTAAAPSDDYPEFPQ
jgi:hypothetical protein